MRLNGSAKTYKEIKLPRLSESYVRPYTHIRPTLWHLAVMASYVAIVCGFGSGWFKTGLPAGDMGGTVAGLTRWCQILENGQLISTWNDSWFCGHSRALFNLNGGMELAYAPFLLFGDELAAVKIGALAYLGLSGFSMFLLLRYVLRYQPAAYLLGLAYALHPIPLSVTAADSHANFPPFYFIQPIVVWFTLRLVERPNAQSIARLALIAALAGWLDFERMAILVPWLGMIVVGMFIWNSIRRIQSVRSCWNYSGDGPIRVVCNESIEDSCTECSESTGTATRINGRK